MVGEKLKFPFTLSAGVSILILVLAILGLFDGLILGLGIVLFSVLELRIAFWGNF
jgi:hypothetical protein